MQKYVIGGVILDYYIYFFSQCIYITLTLAIGVIAFNTYNSNQEKFSIFLGVILAVSGILEGLYILSSIEFINNLYSQVSMPLLMIATSLPAIGLVFSFNYIKNNEKNWTRDIIIIILIVGIASIFINYIVLDLEYKTEIYIDLFKIVNVCIVLLDVFSYLRLKKYKYYFDNFEYNNLKYAIFLMVIARMEVVAPRIEMIFVINIISDILNIIATCYMYRFIVHLNLKKPYEKLSKINNELTMKTNRLKDNNQKLLDENIKIQKLKESLTSKESRLKSTLEAAVNGVLAVDKNKNILYKNRRFIEIFNVGGNIYGKSFNQTNTVIPRTHANIQIYLHVLLAGIDINSRIHVVYRGNQEKYSY